MPAMIRLAIDAYAFHPHSALRNSHEAAQQIQSEGFHDIPAWIALVQGSQPVEADADNAEPDEGRKGWQREASKYRNRTQHSHLLSSLGNTGQARLRSSSGPNAARWLWAIPHEQALTIDSAVFRSACCRRLGLPMQCVEDACEGCGIPLDEMGYHRLTCMRTGRVQCRHKHIIKGWRRIFREAGVNIPDRNVERTLGTTHIRRSPQDLRRMDLICEGIDGVFGGAPLFMDATLVSPLHGNGTPMPRSATEDGAAVGRADKKNKEVDYADVEASPHAQLLCLGVETYGRWSSHSLQLIRQLVKHKCSNLPPYLEKSMQHSYYRRWWSLLSVCVQKTLTESILRSQGADLLPAADSLAPLSASDMLDLHR